MSSLTPYFEQVPILAALPTEVQKRLERLAEPRQYRRREVIHLDEQAAESVYLLCDGRIKISRVSEQGREVTLFLLDGSEIFGEMGLTEPNHAYEMLAEMLEDSLVCTFRRADFLAAVQDSPAAMLALLNLVSRRREQAEAQVADLVFLEVPRRLAKLILRLHDGQGGRVDRGGGLLRAKLTHQELANVIGSTRETTTLILNDFKRRGLVDFQGRRILIQSRAGLESLLHNGSVALTK